MGLRLLFAVVFSALTALPVLGNAGDTAPARAPVEALNGALIQVMREADRLGYAGRYANLDPVLRDVFDFQRMARISAGRFWRDFAPAEQAAFTERFARMSIATFADRFDGFSGQRFEIGGTEEVRPGVFLVRNQIVDEDGEAVPIDYAVHEAEGAWRIVDVLLDGRYSELAVRRSEYTSVLRRNGGLAGLMDALDRKIAQIERAAAG